MDKRLREMGTNKQRQEQVRSASCGTGVFYRDLHNKKEKERKKDESRDRRYQTREDKDREGKL